MSETIPERVERIMHEHNVNFREALRVAFAESRIEQRKQERRTT
jgi:hypothetical protein